REGSMKVALPGGKVDPGETPTAAALRKLAPGTYCRHKSWGVGRVAAWNLLASQILVDFNGRKGHAMQARYAAETLTPLPDSHIQARAMSDPAGVLAASREDPLGLAASILRDLGGKATADEVASCLVPSVMDAAAFKKFWEAAKKKMKSDGRFRIPTKKTGAFELLDEAVPASKNLLESFHSARFLKDQVAALDHITKALDDFAHEVEELQSLAHKISEAAGKGQRLQPAQALEMLLARDEILARHESLTPSPGAPSASEILNNERHRLPALFAALPAAKQRRALELFPKAFGDQWPEAALRLAAEAPARLLSEIARLFIRESKAEILESALARAIADRSISSEALIWLAKERGGPFPALFTHDLLNAIFSALERDLLNEKRGSRLRDLPLDDATLIGDLLAQAPPDVVRNAMRRLMLSPIYQDLDKRSLLGRIVKLFPAMQSLLGGEDEEGSSEEGVLTVSWASLESRKAAYERLVQVEIPQNVRDIQVAREQGDLRENFGFKAAKEQQRVLARRKAEAERDLARARGTNFENPDTSKVSIGTVVTIQREGSTATESFSILGAWDSAPELGIVSYKAGIGQALLGRSPGETVELPSEHGTSRAQILSIAPFTDLETLRTRVHKLTAEAPA
ncbi:MAG: GreA/GreB family elongation factor, partial [Terrimicrobiaceae bacterium]|nr:GreA/GreB family elongation factor [Terrimicrobiaceae bacterium]